MNGEIHDGDLFIVVFGDYGPVINNFGDIHEKVIKQADFFDSNPFCTRIINERAFRAFGTFQLAARRFGKIGEGVPSRRVPPIMLWGSVGVLPTTLPDSNMFGHDNRRCYDFVLGLW